MSDLHARPTPSVPGSDAAVVVAPASLQGALTAANQPGVTSIPPLQNPAAGNVTQGAPGGAPANDPSAAGFSAPLTQGAPGGMPANGNHNPRHTAVTRDPASTPGYFRVLLAALPARYFVRGLLTGFQDANGKDLKIPFLGGWPASTAEKMVQPVIDFVEGRATSTEARTQAEKVLRFIGSKNPEEKLASGEKLYKQYCEAREDHQQTSTASDTEIQQRLKKLEQRDHEMAEREYVEDFKKDIGKKARKRIIESKYDTVLGIGSTAVTLSYGWRVYNDIKNMFAEAVAYETGKSSDGIRLGDLRASENVLVQDSLKNLGFKSIARLLGDSLFFARYLTKWVPRLNNHSAFGFGDIAVGVKGGQLLWDITSKKTTFFEDLLQLIDKKLNPIRGIGDPLSSSEVIDLYQKFAITHAPKLAFSDATIRQNRDGVDWHAAHAMFTRVTTLMNATYKYKHGAGDVRQGETADFALPKFLYLLGHKLINPYKPKESLAYIEIANAYGMEAVKQMHAGITQGAALEDFLKKYPVDLSAIAPRPAQETPQVPVSFFPAAAHSLPQPANQQHSGSMPTPKISALSAEEAGMVEGSTHCKDR